MSNPGVVRIGRTLIRVPTGVRQDLAEEIAENLSARLNEIEAAATRIDTQAFALEVAFEAYLRLHELAEERHQESAELTKSLMQVNEELERLLAERTAGAPQPSKTTPFKR